MANHVVFFNGQKMPIIGLGTWSAKAVEMRAAVNAALEAGYRHIDTAFTYMNEEAIGEVLADWISEGKVKREELFIVTKLPMVGIRQSDVEKYLKESLKRLKLDYVDLYIIHAPLGILADNSNINNVFPAKEDGTLCWDMATDLESVWKGMEDQVEAGRTKSIGLSNFSESQIRRIMKVARIQPANLQVEVHAYFMQKPLRAVCAEFGITVCAYSPLGSPGRQVLFDEMDIKDGVIPDILQNPVVTKLADKLKRSPAQVLLRYLTQQRLVVIPKSTNPKRINDNYQIFDFELSDDDVSNLDSLDQGRNGRTYDWTFFKGAETHPEYPFGE